MAKRNPVSAFRPGVIRGGSRLLSLALLSLPSACASPAFPGYQIQEPPEHFLYDASSTQDLMIFPDREVMAHSAWWRMDTDDRQASIAITRFRGAATADEVEEARGRYVRALADSGGGEVTPLQFLRIDGREAWGWEEHREADGQLSSVVSRTVVLYDTMAIGLEFYSDIPEWMDPLKQKATLATFGYGRTRILWGWLILFLALAGVGLGRLGRRLAKATKSTLAPTDYELPSIPKTEDGIGVVEIDGPPGVGPEE